MTVKDATSRISRGAAQVDFVAFPPAHLDGVGHRSRAILLPPADIPGIANLPDRRARRRYLVGQGHKGLTRRFGTVKDGQIGIATDGVDLATETLAIREIHRDTVAFPTTHMPIRQD
jgi:hypothetical protein